MYRDEFESIQEEIKEKQLKYDFHLITAFSRENQHKVYVQHKLLEYQEQVWKMLNDQKGYFYLCGYVLTGFSQFK